MLDGKQITDNSRQFLMSWKASREAQQMRERSKADFNDASGVYSTHNGKLKLQLKIFEMFIED
jgi:hypothetical protein